MAGWLDGRMGSMKVTIAFANDELYRQVKIRSASSGRPIRDIVEEALGLWLQAAEDEEDVRASAAALDEYATAGGVDADAYFQRLVAEDRVTYETD
jgi:plasmid stability protein